MSMGRTRAVQYQPTRVNFEPAPCPADGGEAVDLSHDQARRLGQRFAKVYSERLQQGLDDLTVGARVSVKVDRRRKYGSLQEITEEGVGHVKLEGRDTEIFKVSLEQLRRRRTRLSRSTKKRWARELCILGGPSAIGRAYRKWTDELRKRLLVVRHQNAVLAQLACDHEHFTLPELITVFRRVSGITNPVDAATILFDRFKDTAPGDSPLQRRRGRFDSLTWKDDATRDRYRPSEG